MPELPEAETITRHLRRELVGEVFDKVIHCRRDVVRFGPKQPGRWVRNAPIVSVERRGKRPIVRFENDRGMVFFLGMTGRLSVQSARDPVERHTHLRIGLADGTRDVLFNDAWRFGGLVFYDCANGCEPEGILGLGPEPLEMTPDRFRAVCRKQRQIKALMLDQVNIAGMGNIYCDEALHRVKIHPLTRAMDLEPRQVGQLLRSIKRVLTEAIEHEGSTIINYLHPDGPGNFQSRLRVYGHEGEPCKRCKAPIERIIAAGRSSFFCPACQRAPQH